KTRGTTPKTTPPDEISSHPLAKVLPNIYTIFVDSPSSFKSITNTFRVRVQQLPHAGAGLLDK
ncbi:MAG: hypothetical protein NT023_04735, partial [Armatimonadetes bacterium]|nr:hypothetical protein [Armatimonadota bacterium]